MNNLATTRHRWPLRRYGVIACCTAGTLLSTLGCDDHKKSAPVPSAPASSAAPHATIPNAQISPDDPSETEPDDAGTTEASVHVGIPADSNGRLILDAAPPPAPQPIALTANEPLPADTFEGQEISGVTLTATWKWLRVPETATVPEVATSAINKLKNKTQNTWNIELAELGRMRIVFGSPAFTINQFAELRARTSIYGHVLVWPDAVAYRSLPVGTLRPLLDERRVDVTPLTKGHVRKKIRHGSKFGFPTNTDNISTPWGNLQLEQMRSPNVGTGGRLLCRTLVELVGARPSSPVCAPQRMPVQAIYRWRGGTGIEFTVDTFVIRTDFPASTFLTPPRNATFKTEGLPPGGAGIFLTRKQLAQMRKRPSKPANPRSDPEAVGAPGEGIILHNYTNAMKFFLLDGVAVAWVKPHERKYIIGPQKGVYATQWRSFMGWSIGKTRQVRVPAQIIVGEPPDAGAPKPASSAK